MIGGGGRSFGAASRGVSTTLGYVLALAISAILVSGLLIAGGTFVEDNRERVVRAELRVVGQQVSSSVETVDRLAVAGRGDTAAAVGLRLPAEAAEVGYGVALVPDGSDAAVEITADEVGVTVRVGVVTDTPVDTGTSVRGGDVELFVTDAGEISIRRVAS